MDEIKNMGVGYEDIGTHSCRKGVATIVASGCNVYPLTVLILIFAGCVMVGMKNNCYPRECGGDKYFGRCASRLNHLE